MAMSKYVLTLKCLDRPGIVAGVTTKLFEAGGNVSEAQQFDDSVTGNFFMRVEFELPDSAAIGLRAALVELKELIGTDWKLRPMTQKKKVLILVSKYDHCLVDLFYRNRIGDMNMDIVAVASNHPIEPNVQQMIGNVPYHHFPVTKETKRAQEKQIQALIESTGAELVLLARYMQILSDEFSVYLSGRCINIHHSFLPGFKGAQPYHQAYERGVKIIGATAHYVTGDLDEGPIIEQDVVQVTHADTPVLLTAKGRDVERRVFSRAVMFHLEDRVFINGNKTVVFRR